MKKLLAIILTIVTIFTLASCNKKKATPRNIDSFLVDFSFEKENYANFYNAIIKPEGVENRMSQFGYTNRLPIRTKNKVKITEISYKVYNHSEDTTFYISNFDEPFFIKQGDDVWSFGSAGDQAKYPTIAVLPGEKIDVSLTFEKGTVKANKTIIFYFQFITYTNPEKPTRDDTDMHIKNITNASGICDFKVNYTAYL